MSAYNLKDIQLLALRRIWIAPVGNSVKRTTDYLGGHSWKVEQSVRGYMVCHRTEASGPAVVYLNATAKAALSCFPWKRPFRENEHLFPTFEEALEAALKVAGIGTQKIGAPELKCAVRGGNFGNRCEEAPAYSVMHTDGFEYFLCQKCYDNVTSGFYGVIPFTSVIKLQQLKTDESNKS